jgi:hypothetical protein
MSKHDGFQSSFRSTPVFACGICMRNTRRTSQGNRDLCPQCDEFSMIENGISDNSLEGDELAHAEAEILKLKKAALAKGGNAERLGL